jgi:hypothetical protein
VILSLWVDGSNSRPGAGKNSSSAAASRPSRTYQNRFVLPAETVEEEFTAAGFRIQERLDFLPFYVAGLRIA